MPSANPARVRIVFATHAYEDARTGPAVYARYLWDAFRDDPDIEFHLVAPDGPPDHPRSHRFVPAGAGSRHFYAALRDASLVACRKAGPAGILHLNAPHYALFRPTSGWRLWLQLNDYEGARLPGELLPTLGSGGPRRLMTLILRRWIERRMLRRCDLALANSDYTRHAVLDAYPEIPPARALTLHKAVDLAFFAGTRIPSRLGRGRRFVFLGSNFRVKRLHLAVEAFAGLSSGAGVLRIAGCTKDDFVAAYPSLATVAAHPDVSFLGKLGRDAVRELLLDSDVLLLPSRSEALGVAALEAIACGCRVIGARVGGISEIVDNPEVGRLVDVPSSDAWKVAMADEIASGATLGPYRETLLARFSAERMLGQLRRLYLKPPHA